MKLRYIIATLAAAAALFTGCKEEGDTYFDEIRVSSSYIGMPKEPQEGEVREITVTATEAWKFVEESLPDPEWLTITPLSGEAGVTVVKFQATKTEDDKKIELQIACGPRIQRIILTQSGSAENVEVPVSKISDVMSGPETKYRVKGVVTRIHGAHYGNMYLNDGTVEDPGLQIWGTLDKKGNKMTSSTAYDCFNSGHENAWEIAVGDIVTVEGPMTIYQGAAELVDVTIIEIEKSLVKIIPMEIVLDGPEAGDTLVKIASKAESLKVRSNDDWLYVKEIENTADTVYARIGFLANEGVVKREGSLTVSGKDVKDMKITVSQGANAPGLMTIAEACKQPYSHAKGKISAINKQGYILSDDSGSINVYYGKNIDLAKYKIGDEIEIIGDVVAYYFGPQFSCKGKDGFDLEEKLSEGAGSYSYPTPEVLDAAALDAFVTSSITDKTKDKLEDAITVKYVQVVGVPKLSGTYTNIYVGEAI